ncbi:MAG: peptidylprolyl isomerase [Candidatus Sulfotelmatobacter sp.]|jgi:hypothetical protein
MRKSWLLCVLLGTLSWGQAAPGAPRPAPPAPGADKPPAAQADTSASVPDNAPVITVKGVCAPQPKTTAAKGTAAKPAAAAKTPPADCKTVITKAEFETLLKAIPNANPQVKRNIAGRIPMFIAWSNEAKKQGIDKTPQFAEMMKLAKMQILTSGLQQKVQEDAAKVPEQAIADYYKKNPEAYEQFSLERMFVPRTKQAETEAKEEKEEEKKDEKPTEEQLKAKQAEEKAKQEANEEAMSKLAESLRARAAAGEDFTQLQKEAFDAAGMKIQSPTVSMPNVRRAGLPPAHLSVFDLKPGEVSPVINDAGGHYIYKVKSKEQLSLDQVKDEIRRTLQSQRQREAMDKINNSFTVEKNDAYFGPEQAGMPGAPRMPAPRMAPAPNAPVAPANGGGGIGQQPPPQMQTPPPAQAPAPPPAAKPN